MKSILTQIVAKAVEKILKNFEEEGKVTGTSILLKAYGQAKAVI